MISLCSKCRCGERKPWVMSKTLMISGVCCLMLLKKLATFVILLFPILKHGELPLQNQPYTQKVVLAI